MKLKHFLLLNTLLAFIGGLGLVFNPVGTFSFQGIALSEGGAYAAQIMGILLLGFGAISWKARRIQDTGAVASITKIFAFIHIGIVVLNIMALQSGLVNGSGWGDLVLHGVLGLGFLYYAVKMK